jgi:hypothetical protein
MSDILIDLVLPKVQIQVKNPLSHKSRSFTIKGVDVDQAIFKIEELFKRLEECDGSVTITHYKTKCDTDN